MTMELSRRPVLPAAGGSAPTGKAPRSRPRRVKTAAVAAILLSPYLVFLAVVYVYPLISSVNISFRDYTFSAPSVSLPQPFVGLKNYRDVLGDPVFRRSLLNIAELLIINVPLTVGFGLLLACGLNLGLRGQRFLRIAYYLPYVTASVAVIGVWYWLFAQNGLINSVLGSAAPQPSWLINGAWAMPIIALEITWKQLGFYVILYLAQIRSIPKNLYEAATVDGAGPVRSFFAVTVPGTRSATALVVILSLVAGINVFTEPYLLTNGGGPDNATMTPVLRMYQRGIEQGSPGYAAAVGTLLAAVVFLLAAAGALIRRARRNHS